MGDESGMVKIQDLSYIIKHYKLEPKDFATDNPKRNPHRALPLEKYQLDSNTGNEGDNNSDDDDKGK
jgi:hypothetical protein